MNPIVTELSNLKGITLGSLNIRSLYRSIDDLHIILPPTELDVLVLHETFLNNTVSDLELEIEEYHMFRTDHPVGSQ